MCILIYISMLGVISAYICVCVCVCMELFLSRGHEIRAPTPKETPEPFRPKMDR